MDYRDLENEGAPGKTSLTAQAHDKETYTPSPAYSSRLSHSSSSAASTDSDPLAPLERALTVDLFTDAEHLSREEITYTRTGASIATTGSRPPSFEVDFDVDDPEDPKNFPLWYRSVLIFCVSYATWTVVLYSTSYTSSMPGMMEEFHIKKEVIATLGVTTYLLGLACGSLILAPLSEIYGRRPVYIGSLSWYCILVLPCALAKNLPTVLVCRFFGALGGAAMIANSPGTVADIVTEHYRALAFCIWSIGPMNGPVTGPLIGGFTAQYLGWRWTNWLVMIMAGVGAIICGLMKETYAPVVLQKKAARIRKETGDDRYWSRYDQKLSIIDVLKVNLSRPFVLAFTEPILWFWNGYIAIIYGILYLCFVAYPLIYSDMRGWGLGVTGLSFIGIGVGTILAIITEPLARKMVNAQKKDPETGRVTPEASVSVVCIASILCPVGQLWFSWTATPVTIHWIWPILAGIPFGAGNTLVFIYASNYMAGCYGIYAASALASNSVIRSLFGATLPLAGPYMYKALTPNWAGTLLGLTQVALIPIPFAFYKWGPKIRGRSRLIRQMRADQEKNEQRLAAAKRLQDKKLASQRGEPMMADEAAIGDGEKEGVAKTAVPVTDEKEKE